MSDATALRRTTFYEELSRRRRRGWIVGAVCALVSAGVGMVLSAIVTPIVLLVLGAILKLAGGLGLGPAKAGVTLIHDFALVQMEHFEAVIDALDLLHGPGDLGLLAEPLSRLAPVVWIALVAGALAWLWLRGVFSRGGHEDLIVRLKARPANTADLEERQLANIVEEVAIGAGAPAPRLFLIDTETVNAGAFGRSHKDGVVVFTRGMLEALDRDETEAVAARLVSAIGAGDLRAAAGVMAVFQTFGFFLTVLDLTVRWTAWRTLGLLALASINPRPSADLLGRLGQGLDDGLQAEAMPDIEKILARFTGPLRTVAQVVLLPWLFPFLISLLYKLVLFLWTAFFLGPPMAALWRNRCYWTDALTVKLARNPEAFARALETIGAADPPPGGEAFAYLFIAGPTAARRAAADRKTMTTALTPDLGKRLARLGAMGAGLRPQGGGSGLRSALAHPVRFVIVALLCLLLAPLFFALFALIGYLTAIVMTFGLAAGMGMVLWLT